MSNSRLLICMKGGEAYEVSLDTSSTSLLCEGHGYGELHALDINSVKEDEYVTGGDDGAVRVWSFEKRTCLRRTNLGTAIRAIAWNPIGTQIVVGFGGDPKNTAKDGAFSILDSRSLDILYEDRKAKQWITDIKFSDTAFAVMSNDGTAYIHDLEKFNLIKRIETPNKATAGIVRCDFSNDFEYIRMSTTSSELYYYKPSGELIASPITVRNVTWNTNTCSYNWMAKGILQNRTRKFILIFGLFQVVGVLT
jgi:WD40 repeat protein